jgi:hypothetical protein
MGTNKRKLTVAGLLGDADTSLTRRLGMTPVSVDSTDDRSADGTHR